MGAPPDSSGGWPTEESRAQKSDRRHRAADGRGPVALADRQGKRTKRAPRGTNCAQAPSLDLTLLIAVRREAKRHAALDFPGRPTQEVAVSQSCMVLPGLRFAGDVAESIERCELAGVIVTS